MRTSTVLILANLACHQIKLPPNNYGRIFSSFLCHNNIEPPRITDISCSSDGSSTVCWSPGATTSDISLKYELFDDSHSQLLQKCGNLPTRTTFKSSMLQLEQASTDTIIKVGIQHDTPESDVGGKLGCVYSKPFVGMKTNRYIHTCI